MQLFLVLLVASLFQLLRKNERLVSKSLYNLQKLAWAINGITIDTYSRPHPLVGNSVVLSLPAIQASVLSPAVPVLKQ
jgi:hypothetical protein